MAILDQTEWARPVLEQMLEQITKSAKPLIKVLIEDIGDTLEKYQNDSGGISPGKIPQKLWIVAIVFRLEHIARANGWGLAMENGGVYVYNGRYWERMDDDQLMRFLSEAAVKMGYHSPADAMTHTFKANIVKQYVAHVPLLQRNDDPDRVLINLQNGTFEVTAGGGRLRKHRPDDSLTYVLPYSYDEKAKRPLFDRYLNRVLPDSESRDVLQEFHGYVFSRALKLEKALILYGNGANGKSVQFEVTRALFGEANVSTKTLGDLIDNDSGNDNRAKLKDKLLNYGSEIRGEKMDIDIFKRLVSGEPVAAREKYKTGFDLQNTCKFIFNANTLPKETERTHAYFRRFLIVPYTETIHENEKDTELHRKIIANELPGVLNWAIAGLMRLLKNKDFSRCEASAQVLEAYKKESNSVVLFIEDESLIPDSEARYPNKSLYTLYKEWCIDNGMRPLNNGNFSKELLDMGFERYKSGGERGFYIIRSI